MRAICFCSGLTFTTKLLEGALMLLADLIKTHDEYVSQLMTAIEMDGDSELINQIDQKIQLLANSIRDIHLSSAIDINLQIKFFLNRSSTNGEDTLTGSDRKTVERLIDRYTDRRALTGTTETADTHIDTKIALNLKNKRFLTDERIEQSNARIALYNLDYQYEYTSVGNARFHGADPAEFVGRHVADIVGDSRFRHRAKHYYDRCFSGEKLNYSYFLEVQGMGERLMECELTPYRDHDGCVRGAYFAIEDITDKLDQARLSASENAVN